MTILAALASEFVAMPSEKRREMFVAESMAASLAILSEAGGEVCEHASRREGGVVVHGARLSTDETVALLDVGWHTRGNNEWRWP